MTYIIYYIIAGFIWTGILEFLTTKFPDDKYPVDWRWALRILMIIFWPVTFVIFWIAFIRGIIQNFKT